MTNGPGTAQGWPTPGPIRGVIFDIHSTLVDQGDADAWLDAALAVATHPFTADQRAAMVAFLDRIWEGARASGRKVAMLFWQQSLGEAVDAVISPAPAAISSRPQALPAA